MKVINIDPTGKIRLSRKALLQDEAAERRAAPAPARQGVGNSVHRDEPGPCPGRLKCYR